MTKKEQLRRRIIELIHGVPYEEAVKYAIKKLIPRSQRTF